MTTQVPPPALATLIDDLAYRYDGVFSRETVQRLVEESYQALSGTSAVPDFLPLLTARFAKDRLAALAKAEGKAAAGTPEVLFICVRNAGRSQMAAALLEHRSGGRVHVRSAGSQPGDGIHPVVSEAMAEIGIDLTEAHPKPLTDDVVRASDVVVTMGCGDACPIYPGKRYLDRDLPDPHGQPLDVVRDIRDRIDARVGDLLRQILPVPQQAARSPEEP